MKSSLMKYLSALTVAFGILFAFSHSASSQEKPAETDPYNERGLAADGSTRHVSVNTLADSVPAPRLGDLSGKGAVSQYGVTWTFEKPAPVGRFVNGDWYPPG